MHFPTQFSLRALLIAIGVVSLGAAIWNHAPDRNNTLPIGKVVAPDVARQLRDPKYATEPTILLIANSSATPHPQFALINTTAFPIRYSGYSPDSYSSYQNRGDINPFYAVEIQTGGAWVNQRLGRCGNGSAELTIKPGHAGRFDVSQADPTQPWRIGLVCQWVDNKKTAHRKTIWSKTSLD